MKENNNTRKIYKAFSVAKWKEEGDWFEECRRILFLWLGAVSILGWIGSLCNLTYGKVATFIGILALVLLLTYLRRIPKEAYNRNTDEYYKKKHRIIDLSYGLLPLIAMILPPVQRGFCGLSYETAKTFAKRGVQAIFTGYETDSLFSRNLVLILFSCWIILLMKICYEQKKYIAGILMLIMLLVEMRLGDGSSTLWIILWMFWLLLLLISTFRAYLFLTAPLLILAFLFLLIFGNSQGKGWQETWEHLRYGERVTVLPDGDLSQAGKMKRSKQKMLLLSEDVNGYYYLKGFVGTVYDDNAWENESQTLDDFESGILKGNDDFLSWLHGKGYSGWNQLASAMNVSNEKVITIKNKNANRKYLYLPYELTTSIKQIEEENLAVSSSGETLLATGLLGRSSYRIKTGESIAGTGVYTPQNSESLNQAYDAYSEYVSRSCLTLPKEVKETMLTIFGGTNTVGVDDTMAIVKKIRDWLKKHVTYSEEPGNVPEGREFTEWFLKDNPQGYDVQYATIAVMMFRYYGIPARYVEGYLVEEQSNLTQKSAHAWPEIYIYGRGWIPVEVMESYQERMPSYLPEKGETLHTNDKEMEAQQKDGQTQQNQSDPQKEQEKTDDSQNMILNNIEESGSILPIILGLILLTALLLLLLAVLFLRFKEHYFKKWATESISAERCIVMWYRYCIWLIYELEDDLKIKAAMTVDNRVSQWEEYWLKWHPDVDRERLAQVGLLRQKAIYRRKGVSWDEVNPAVDFLQSEYQYLFGKLSLEKKLRVRLGIKPAFFRRKG